MPLLKCNVKTCYHNEENKCSLNSIMVEGSHADTAGDTDCGSFRLKGENATNGCNCSTPKDKVSIECEAENCTYNSNRKCSANDIGIDGASACTCVETKCATFKM